MVKVVKFILLDKENHVLKLVPQSLTDLWHLSNIVEVGDEVSARTMRAVKFGNKEERIPVFITIAVEKHKFFPEKNALRLTGKIIFGKPEDLVQLGRYHSIDVSIGSEIKVVKQQWGVEIEQEIRKIKKEQEERVLHVLLIDDKDAIMYKVSPFDIKPLFSHRIRQGSKEESTTDYKPLIEWIQSHGLDVLAGPGFEKEVFYKALRQELGEKVKGVAVFHADDIEIGGLKQLLSSNKIEQHQKVLAVQQEQALWSRFLMHLGKEDGLVVYGEEEVKQALEWNACEIVLVTLDCLRSSKGVRDMIERYKHTCEVVVFNANKDCVEALSSFGGVAAILRYRLR